MRARLFRFIPLLAMAGLLPSCGRDAGSPVNLPAFGDTITDGALQTQFDGLERRGTASRSGGRAGA